MGDKLKLAFSELITTQRHTAKENCSHYVLTVTACKVLEASGNAIREIAHAVADIH